MMDYFFVKRHIYVSPAQIVALELAELAVIAGIAAIVYAYLGGASC